MPEGTITVFVFPFSAKRSRAWLASCCRYSRVRLPEMIRLDSAMPRRCGVRRPADPPVSARRVPIRSKLRATVYVWANILLSVACWKLVFDGIRKLAFYA
jgi:hypothetical protein